MVVVSVMAVVGQGGHDVVLAKVDNQVESVDGAQVGHSVAATVDSPVGRVGQGVLVVEQGSQVTASAVLVVQGGHVAGVVVGQGVVDSVVGHVQAGHVASVGVVVGSGVVVVGVVVGGGVVVGTGGRVTSSTEKALLSVIAFSA